MTPKITAACFAVAHKIVIEERRDIGLVFLYRSHQLSSHSNSIHPGPDPTKPVPFHRKIFFLATTTEQIGAVHLYGARRLIINQSPYIHRSVWIRHEANDWTPRKPPGPGPGPGPAAHLADRSAGTENATPGGRQRQPGPSITPVLVACLLINQLHNDL